MTEYVTESNVAPAHPIAAELRGITIKSTLFYVLIFRSDIFWALGTSISIIYTLFFYVL